MAEETWIVDRIEGDVAVVEDEAGNTFDVPLAVLPADIREGDVLHVERDPGVILRSVRHDAEATGERRRQLESLLNELRQRDPGGDIEL